VTTMRAGVRGYDLIPDADMVVGLMRHDPSDPYRQGYKFGNALLAVANIRELTASEVALAAEKALKVIIDHPEQFPIVFGR
jgi:hypothetical protein